MKVLIIGFGSIGKRHYEILNNFDDIDQIDIVSKQDLNNIISFPNLKSVNNIEKYDYYIVANETSKHFKDLQYICSKVQNKKILVEKPLYDKLYENLICNNEVFTAYNLRFHPAILQLKELLLNEKVYYVNAICGQYLPTWRVDQDYKKSYSSDIKQGGGVLRDLSHELDYIYWLFGEFDLLNSINTKVSDLEITSDDIFTAIGITQKGIIINLTVDYISKIPMRKIIVHSINKSIEVDIIKNTISIGDKQSNINVTQLENIDRNYTYTKMHESLLCDDFNIISSFEDGQNVVKIIDNIEFKEFKYG